MRNAKFHSGQYLASVPVEHSPVTYPSQTSYTEDPPSRYQLLPQNMVFSQSACSPHPANEAKQGSETKQTTGCHQPAPSTDAGSKEHLKLQQHAFHTSTTNIFLIKTRSSRKTCASPEIVSSSFLNCTNVSLPKQFALALLHHCGNLQEQVLTLSGWSWLIHRRRD